MYGSTSSQIQTLQLLTGIKRFIMFRQCTRPLFQTAVAVGLLVSVGVGTAVVAAAVRVDLVVDGVSIVVSAADESS